jgi:hypothetical protein
MSQQHDFLTKRGAVRSIYEAYRNNLMIANRRSGRRVMYLSGDGHAKDTDDCFPPFQPVYASHGEPTEEEKALCGTYEADCASLHAAQLCTRLHTVRAALKSPSRGTAVDESGGRSGSPPISLGVGRANRTNSVASTTELMELFRSDQLNPKSVGADASSTATPSVPLSSTNVVHVVPSVHVVSGVAPPALSHRVRLTSSPLPPPCSNLGGGRRRSTSSNGINLPTGKHKRPLSTFAKQRLGQMLADIIISCAAISEGAQLENVEDVVTEPPVLVLSTPNDEGSSSSRTRTTSGGPAGKHSPCQSGFEEQIQANFQRIVRSSKSFVAAPPGAGGAFMPRGQERNLSDGEESAPPFLNFDIVNSAEDLTAFEDDGSEWGSGSRDAVHQQVLHQQARKYHAPAHHHAVGHQQHGSSGSHSASSPNNGYSSSHALPPAYSSGSLLHSNSTSNRHLQIPHNSGKGKPESGAPRAHGGPRLGGDQPRSPSSSILFRPALSFTSVESPRSRRPPSASPQGFIYSASPHPSSIYTVDEGRLQVFLQSLHDVKEMVSSESVDAKEFTDLGLRYIVPGVFYASPSTSMAPTPFQGAMVMPPALTGFLQDALSLPPPMDNHGQRRTDPLGSMVPRTSSIEGLDAIAGAGAGSATAGQVSRMSSFRAATASPTAESVCIVENGHQRVVTLKEFPIFLAAVNKTLMDVDQATGNAYNLSEQFRGV